MFKVFQAFSLSFVDVISFRLTWKDKELMILYSACSRSCLLSFCSQEKLRLFVIPCWRALCDAYFRKQKRERRSIRIRNVCLQAEDTFVGKDENTWKNPRILRSQSLLAGFYKVQIFEGASFLLTNCLYLQILCYIQICVCPLKLFHLSCGRFVPPQPTGRWADCPVSTNETPLKPDGLTGWKIFITDNNLMKQERARGCRSEDESRAVHYRRGE